MTSWDAAVLVAEVVALGALGSVFVVAVVLAAWLVLANPRAWMHDEAEP